MTKIKNFILLDLTLFIIIFIFLGGFIGYIFFFASQLDSTTKNKQKALEISEVYMKTILNITSYEQLINYNLDENLYYFDKENLEIHCFYDIDWQIIPIFADNPTNSPKETEFEILISLNILNTLDNETIIYTSNDGYAETKPQSYKLININISIKEQKKKSKKEILNLNTNKYFLI